MDVENDDKITPATARSQKTRRSDRECAFSGCIISSTPTSSSKICNRLVHHVCLFGAKAHNLKYYDYLVYSVKCVEKECLFVQK